jgi:hypothetical protein
MGILAERRMEGYRRYGRWLRRAAWVIAGYVFFAWLFMGLSPSQSLTSPQAVLTQLRPFMLQALILVSFIILQFGAMFRFLSRGNDYVIYPGEYDTSFDDVRGQPAAVGSTKEVLRVFEGFKDFKQMGGYPPHGILFEGPPGTGKTLMAKAIAGASGVPFLFATGSGFANMFLGIGNLKVRRLFKKARVMSDKYGGAVIFIDEVDAVGSRGVVSERSAPTGERASDRSVVGAGMGGGVGMASSRSSSCRWTASRCPAAWAARPARAVRWETERALLQHPGDRGHEPRLDARPSVAEARVFRPEDPRRSAQRRRPSGYPPLLPREGSARADRPREALAHDRAATRRRCSRTS